MKNIKFLDLHKQYLSIQSEIDNAIQKVITTSSFIGGDFVKNFEQDFAKYLGVKFCIGVGNGTDALEILIKSFDFPKNSEIILPVNTFAATAEAIISNGLIPVFADCNDFFSIDLNSAKKMISKNTVAIIPVHLYGIPANINDILNFAKEYNLKVIEDSAQAHGATYLDRKVGTFGDGAVFSFYPGKNLGAFGDAGAIVTNNEITARKVKMIANHGREKKYKHIFSGRNSRLDGLQAAILSVKLNYLDLWIKKRNILAKKYEELFDNSDVFYPKIPENRVSARHLFVVAVKNRDKLRSYLKNLKIETGIHYPEILSKQSAFSKYKSDDFYAQTFSKQLLSLPIGEHLEIEDIIFVVKKLLDFEKFNGS